jgi:hypothetical protein
MFHQCHGYTVKRVDGKLRHPDRMTQYSSIRGMEHFFDMQIELIRQFPTIKTKYLDAQQNFSTVFRCHATEFSDNFPSTFRQMNQNKKLHHRGLIQRHQGLQPTTLPLCHTITIQKFSSWSVSEVHNLSKKLVCRLCYNKGKI